MLKKYYCTWQYFKNSTATYVHMFNIWKLGTGHRVSVWFIKGLCYGVIIYLRFSLTLEFGFWGRHVTWICIHEDCPFSSPSFLLFLLCSPTIYQGCCLAPLMEIRLPSVMVNFYPASCTQPLCIERETDSHP